MKMRIPCSRNDVETRTTGYTALHSAAKKGYKGIVQLLLQQPESTSLLTSVDQHGYTPLHVAVENCHQDIFELFLQRGITSNSLTKNSLLPLHIAAQKGHDEIVLQLLERGTHVDAIGKTIITIQISLNHSFEKKHMKMIEIFVDSCWSNIRWEESYTPLYIAAYYGHKSVVEILLDKGADPNASFEKHLTPLHAAAQEGQEQIVNLLLKHGAKVNLEKNDDSEEIFSTALLAAARAGHERIVKMLLHHGADIEARLHLPFLNFSKGIELVFTAGTDSAFFDSESKIRYTPLHFAAEEGKKHIVELLLQYFADVNSTSENATPLGLAVEKEHEAVIQILLEAGANVNMRASNKQEFPLHRAIEKGNEKIVSKLIKYGARLDSLCSEDLSPFFHAVKKSNIEILKILLREGATFESKTTKGVPLLHFAFNEGSSLKMIRFLLRCGADVDAEDEAGLTPLHLVVNKTIFWDPETGENDLGRRNVQIVNEVKLLLEYGAAVNHKSKEKKETILYCAATKAKDYTIEMLLELGANVNVINEIGYTPVLNASKRLWMLDEICEVCHRPTYRDLFPHRWERNVNENYSYYYLDKICAGCNLSLNDIDEMILTNEADSLLPERRTKTLVNVVASITKEIVRLQVAGEDIGEKNQNFIRSETMEFFVKECQAEIEMMKKFEVAKNITYFDILVGSDDNLEIYSKNKIVLEKTKFENDSTEFQKYSKVLRARIMKGKERRFMLEKSKILLEEVLDMKLPFLVLIKIFKYLKREDLIKFEIACKPVNLDSTNDELLKKIGYEEVSD